MTAIELAKRNAARQLLPLPEIKALEHKAKLEAEFDWQKPKAKCLEIVPEYTLSIIIDDMVREGKLERKHISDYDRSSWLLIYNRCREDAEIYDNDGDDDDVETHGEAARLRLCAPGDNTPSSDEQVTCCICGRTLTNKLSVSRCIGPECFKKVGAQGAEFLQDDEVSDELIKALKLYSDEAFQKRILRACLTLDAPLPAKVLRWLGNEFFGYKNRPILYYLCTAGQLNRIDTHRRKLRHVIVTRDTAETELDAHALTQWSTQAKPRLRRVSPAGDVAEDDALERTGETFSCGAQALPSASRVTASPCASTSATREEPLGTMDEFVERCKEAEVRHTGEAFGFACVLHHVPLAAMSSCD